MLPTYRTNITEPGASYASSRGTLVAAFLADPRGDSDLASATTALTAEDTSYAGFNLLLLEPHSRLPTTGTDTDTVATLAYDARLLTNGGGGGHIRARMLSDDECACGGISNGVDGQGGDVWPKVLQGRAALRTILDESSADGPKIADADSQLAERLMELLTCVTASPPPSSVTVTVQWRMFFVLFVSLSSRLLASGLVYRILTMPSMSYEPENRFDLIALFLFIYLVRAHRSHHLENAESSKIRFSFLHSAPAARKTSLLICTARAWRKFY